MEQMTLFDEHGNPGWHDYPEIERGWVPLTFRNYQHQASSTAIYDAQDGIPGLAYTVLGLVGEAGEVAEKVKKYYRDGTMLDRDAVAKELGDVLWYLAMIATEIDFDLSEIAQRNLDKLKSRHARGVIGGSGDDR